MKKRGLIVAAHPDDEVLGCGGTIALMAREWETHIVILGEGVTSRFSHRRQVPSSEVRRLQRQARAAAAILGAQSIGFSGLPDNRFDEVPLLEVIKRVERWVDQLQPTAIYTHHPGDLNVDHRITALAVLTATRPTPECRVREVYAFEVPSSTEWAFQRVAPVFRPNVFVDISRTIDAKLDAMQCYTMEQRAFPHPRSPEALRAIAQRWGSVAGVQHAEALELIRSLR